MSDLDEFLEEVHEPLSRLNDPTFTQALQEIVGERYGDFPEKTLDLLYELWIKAKRVDTSRASAELSLVEMCDVRDVTLQYIADFDSMIPSYPEDADGYQLDPEHPTVKIYQERLEALRKKQSTEFDHLYVNHDIPCIAPLHESIFADALGLVEQRGGTPLLFVFPPRDFVDIRKLHIERWGSGDVQLITDQDPLKGKLWGVPCVSTANLPSGAVYLAAAKPDRLPKSHNPVWHSEGTRQYMAAGRNLFWQRMTITR